MRFELNASKTIIQGSVQLVIFMIKIFKHCNAFHFALRKYKTKFLQASGKHPNIIKYSKIKKIEYHKRHKE